jgi:hypothetical protein
MAPSFATLAAAHFTYEQRTALFALRFSTALFALRLDTPNVDNSKRSTTLADASGA